MSASLVVLVASEKATSAELYNDAFLRTWLDPALWLSELPMNREHARGETPSNMLEAKGLEGRN